jgi:hypothetical protein
LINDSRIEYRSLQNVRDDITETEARDAMEAIIASGVFNYEPSEKLGAAITSRSIYPRYRISAVIPTKILSE